VKTRLDQIVCEEWANVVGDGKLRAALDRMVIRAFRHGVYQTKTAEWPMWSDIQPAAAEEKYFTCRRVTERRKHLESLVHNVSRRGYFLPPTNPPIQDYVHDERRSGWDRRR